jgi:hypothetical protein
MGDRHESKGHESKCILSAMSGDTFPPSFRSILQVTTELGSKYAPYAPQSRIQLTIIDWLIISLNLLKIPEI